MLHQQIIFECFRFAFNTELLETIFVDANIFMQTDTKFLGQHINSYSRLIHIGLPANKIKLFLSSTFCSNRLLAGFTRANAQGAINRINKNFSVADLAGLGRLGNRIHRRAGLCVSHHDFDFDLR